MDPAVIAALIATPTAIIAASAAYAAGRAQAQGAHRGPVDAVRRQHQRDAYATFGKAARSFQAFTHPAAAVVISAAGEDPSSRSASWRLNRARDLRRRAEFKPLLDAYIVVELEGPKHVAELAERVVFCAQSVRRDVITNLLLWGNLAQWVAGHVALADATEAFMVAARDHLNGTGG